MLLSRGTVSHGIHVRADGIKLKTHNPMDIVTQQVTIAPSGTSGWHTHPGIVLVTVFAGTVTFYNEHCKATVIPGRLVVRRVRGRPGPRAQREHDDPGRPCSPPTSSRSARRSSG